MATSRRTTRTRFQYWWRKETNWKLPVLALGICALLVATPATADWTSGDDHKMHFPQEPDPIGWDVCATAPYKLADDFLCTETGLITEVHLWGSYNLNLVTDITNIHLSIHADIPEGPYGYSMPGELLWEWDKTPPYTIAEQLESPQGWMVRPGTSYVHPNHTRWFQYNIYIPWQEAFLQHEDTIYWLDVQVTLEDGSLNWGWKTSVEHWNDDAVYWDNTLQRWVDLWDPRPTHPGVSLDMAFVIDGVPVGACCYPDAGGGYDNLCVETTQTDCEVNYLGIYQGDGTMCWGDEACCVGAGYDVCEDADGLCCGNEMSGAAQGPGTFCTQDQACCIDDAAGGPTYTCDDMDPVCCLYNLETPQPGQNCPGLTSACCMPGSGVCYNVEDVCCDEMNGYVSSTHGSCQGGQPDGACLTAPLGACCYPNGTCLDETQADCVDTVGAEWKGAGTYCFGADANGNGIDDACEEPWHPDDPSKWQQLPDPLGWDVYATQPLVLADDWECIETGWVKDVHFWGSWKDDIIGEIDYFVLSFHEDIPADDPQNPFGYSMPGTTLEEFYAYDFVATPLDPPAMEGWFDPLEGDVFPDDHWSFFQYDVYLDDGIFEQLGTATDPVIYWLNISAVLTPSSTEGAQWGWKSSVDHWNDDAVWAEWGDLTWEELYEPSLPLYDTFWIGINPDGTFNGGGGSGVPIPGATGFGEPPVWYFYDWSDEWWNTWYYDHPFSYARMKRGMIEFYVTPLDPLVGSWFEFAVNWSTPEWSDLGHDFPPPPGVDEDLYIGRQVLVPGVWLEGGMWYLLPFEIPDYNPEWVSVDVNGWNFVIPTGDGWIYHDCVQSLDLAFVITGEEEPTGACCHWSKLWRVCTVTTESDCVNNLLGVYQGDGIACETMEACCLTDDSCVDSDTLCCRDDLLGTPQGSTTTCTATEACCFPDGTCEDMDPLCCDDQSGTPAGGGTSCGGIIGCCTSGGTCRNEDQTCCTYVAHGTPQTVFCAGYTEACCLNVAVAPPDCINVDPVCCDDEGGDPSPIGAGACMGDVNGNGRDDACEPPEACCLPNGDCVDTTYWDCVTNLQGDPQGPFTACPPVGSVVCHVQKWTQPPTTNPFSTCPDCFWGWDEWSVWGWGGSYTVVADDFLCETPSPITNVHWWGSYQNYSGTEPPSYSPTHFRIGIWTDEPVGAQNEFSHPRTMIWEWIVPTGVLNERAVGRDYHPDKMDDPETTFRYDFIIPENEWFYQDEWTSGEPTVFWLSIASHHVFGGQRGFPAWGWKTRQPNWNDAAVRITNPIAPEPGGVNANYIAGQPIEWPAETRWDLAFVLTTTQTTPDEPEIPDGEAGFDKNRYISFVPQNPGELTALRVTLISMPADPPDYDFTWANGTQVWVDEPFELCENSGQDYPPVGGCGPAWVGGGPPLTMWASNLQATQYCFDFGMVGLLHVTDCEIVPGATYHVQAIACGADPTNEANYSAPVVINTSEWGDICHQWDAVNNWWDPPNGLPVDIVYDVTAAVDKFSNKFGAPIKPRADIDPNVVDYKINITSDVTKLIDAFGGDPYPFAGPGTCPP